MIMEDTKLFMLLLWLDGEEKKEKESLRNFFVIRS